MARRRARYRARGVADLQRWDQEVAGPTVREYDGRRCTFTIDRSAVLHSPSNYSRPKKSVRRFQGLSIAPYATSKDPLRLKLQYQMAIVSNCRLSKSCLESSMPHILGPISKLLMKREDYGLGIEGLKNMPAKSSQLKKQLTGSPG